MTKRHFEQAAALIRTAETSSIEARAFAAEVIMRVAAQTNARFDRERFLVACGLA